MTRALLKFAISVFGFMHFGLGATYFDYAEVKRFCSPHALKIDCIEFHNRGLDLTFARLSNFVPDLWNVLSLPEQAHCFSVSKPYRESWKKNAAHNNFIPDVQGNYCSDLKPGMEYEKLSKKEKHLHDVCSMLNKAQTLWQKKALWLIEWESNLSNQGKIFLRLSLNNRTEYLDKIPTTDFDKDITFPQWTAPKTDSYWRYEVLAVFAYLSYRYYQNGMLTNMLPFYGK